MPESTEPIPPDPDGVAARTLRKVRWRVVPVIFAIYIIAYLDRANVGFAKLQMKDRLGFSEAEFGFAFAMFFVGYMLLEIPGALLVEHWSARKWFARILVTWGVCSMGTALVETADEFYVARFLLGLAEAGFFPGVIVYFTHWFPRKDRARAMSLMLTGVPLSLTLGAAVSAGLLRLDWFGLAGWQWVYLVEGAPAVVLGVAVLFLLPDRPRNAKWLTTEEREWLERTLHAERQEAAARTGHMPLGRALRMPTVWLLALGILATNIGGFGLVFWLATTVKDFLGKQNATADDTAVLLWTAPVYLCGLAAVLLSGWSSDRTGDRKWHCVAGQVGAACFLMLSVIPGQPWLLVYAWLCLAGFFANFWFSPYWVLPTLALTSSAAAVSIGFINMCANVPGFISNYVIGDLREAKSSIAAVMAFLAGGFLLGAVFISLVKVPHRTQPGAGAKP